MTVLTLTEIKTHLRLDASDTDEDALLTSLNEAAHDYVEQYLGRSVPWLDSEGAAVPTPASVKAAMLLVLADLYENREQHVVGSITQEIPTVERLLHFYRVGMGI